MVSARFKIGDRVTARYLPAGSIGTVVRVHTTREIRADTRGLIHSRSAMVFSAYFVLFDGWPEVKLMHMRDLEPITDEGKGAREA
jgi:hypothetical protein